MKTNYVYLQNEQEVYRMTCRNYRRFLRKNVKQGYPPDFSEYGKLLCIIDHNVTSWDTWDIDDAKKHLGRDYVYLQFNEAVYRLTRRNFERFLKKTVQQDFSPDLSEYGKLLCNIDHDMTSWDFDDVKRHNL